MSIFAHGKRWLTALSVLVGWLLAVKECCGCGGGVWRLMEARGSSGTGSVSGNCDSRSVAWEEGCEFGGRGVSWLTVLRESTGGCVSAGKGNWSRLIAGSEETSRDKKAIAET